MAEEKAPQKQMSIQKLYVKDISFESPGKNVRPDFLLNLKGE